MATSKIPTSKQAMAIGNALATETLKRRSPIIAKRNAPATGGRSRKPAVVAPALSRAPSGLVKAAATSNAGVVVAEGDSWFDYPFHDVLNLLEDEHSYEVEAVSHRGDTVESMAFAPGQLDDFSRAVEKVLRRRIVPKAILVSGGGNDIAGDEFAILLNHAASARNGLNQTIVSGVIDERLFDAYVTILSAITKLCQELAGRTVPIILHGYDYAVPDGRGFAGGAWLLPGPWLEPGFRQKGYADTVRRAALVRELIDRFNAMLGRVSKQPGFAHIRFLDLRGTLSGKTDYKTWWANELHPTKKGFQAVAKKFAALIG
jgi:hypothetical protein